MTFGISVYSSVLEIGMRQRLFRSDPSSRFIDQHLLEEVKTVIVDLIRANDISKIKLFMVGPSNSREVLAL